MTAGLNLARATCAAESREGSTSASLRNRRQAASREIGVELALANSAAVAHRVSEIKVAILLELLYFDLTRPNPANSVGNDNSGPSGSVPLQLSRKYSHALKPTVLPLSASNIRQSAEH